MPKGASDSLTEERERKGGLRSVHGASFRAAPVNVVLTHRAASRFQGRLRWRADYDLQDSSYRDNFCQSSLCFTTRLPVSLSGLRVGLSTVTSQFCCNCLFVALEHVICHYVCFVLQRDTLGHVENTGTLPISSIRDMGLVKL